MAIPSPLSADYRVATSRDIRSWSFGSLTAVRQASATFSDNIPGTLHDQRIFGPVQDFRCACGKYLGDRYKGMICDRCGVKIAPCATRGSRFGHIELIEPIAHPFASNSELQCFPVIPGGFLESPGGRDLLVLYDELIEASQTPDRPCSQIVASIIDQLAPLVITAHNWHLLVSRTLARGLAIEHTSASDESPPYCQQCGYLLAGLHVVACPGCGAQSP